MENLIKFLEDKITDKMSVEEIVDVFEQMCSTPLEEDMVLFETGTFTAFSKEPFFQISLVRQFSNDDEEFYQIHVVILYKPTAENKIFSETTWDEDLDENISTGRIQRYRHCGCFPGVGDGWSDGDGGV